MKALAYQRPGKKVLEGHPAPVVTQPTGAVVRNVKATIRGNDLHILKGDAPRGATGRTPGHESLGIVDKLGSGVTALHPGDRVIVSCVSSCGKCEHCRKGMYSHCTDGLVWRAI